jgi:hypothetical protein
MRMRWLGMLLGRAWNGPKRGIRKGRGLFTLRLRNGRRRLSVSKRSFGLSRKPLALLLELVGTCRLGQVRVFPRPDLVLGLRLSTAGGRAAKVGEVSEFLVGEHAAERSATYAVLSKG